MLGFSLPLKSKHLMKKLILIYSLFFTAMGFSQQAGTITGQITDQEMNNEPLLYAQIVLKNSEKEVQSNLHGNFEITDVAPGNHMLSISYPGYDTVDVPVEVKANKATTVQTSLAAMTVSLDELALISEKPDFNNENSLLAKEEKD
jgi:hypothetical protein